VTDGEALRIEVDHVDGTAVLRATGEIDLANADELKQALVGTSTPGVVLDLNGVSYLDSAGIRAILTGARALSERSCRFVIVAEPSARVQVVLRIAGLERGLVVDELQGALDLVREDDPARLA
jgi:anti-anti-sigma factor